MKMLLRGLISTIAIFAPVTNAIPTIAFPLNSQVPPAARISTPFSYVFPGSTFSSDLPMTYSLSSGPSWLSLDSNSQTLSGTPSTEDVGTDTVTGVPFGLTASDSTGSITLNATLVVSKTPAPSVIITATQLISSGAFSAPSTLLYHPSTPFNFKFEPGTFANNDSSSSFSYYAITSSNTPLPSWIQFNESTLSFTGHSPDYQSLIQPPQTFGIQLIASDIEGFGGTSLYFDIEVGVHLLAFKNAEIVINGTVGETINFDELLSDLQLDGQSPRTSDIVATSAQTPSWMTFDNSSLALTGTVPADATSVNITIRVMDIYGDMAEAFVRTVISTPLFSRSIGDLNATIGSTFSYDLGIYLSNISDTTLATEILPPQPWLSFDPQTFILSGQIPPSIQPSTMVVTLSATSKTYQTSDSWFFKLLLFADNRTTTSSSSAQFSTTILSQTSKLSTTSRTGEATPIASSSHKGPSKTVILAISIPLGVLFLAMLLALCCYCHRRHAAKKQKEFGKIEKRSISSPLGATPSLAKTFQTIEPIPAIPPPPPLQLSISGFGIQSGTGPGGVVGPISGADTAEKGRYPKGVANNSLRRSKTMLAAADPRLSQLIDSQNFGLGSRVRSKSDNALSENSWRFTRNSTYPTLRSSGTRSSQTQNLTRNYSNYSRKGHTRRSAILISSNSPRIARQSVFPRLPHEESILNLRDSNFSLTPLDSFSILGKEGVFSNATEAIPPILPSIKMSIPAKSARRQSRILPTMDRPRAVGHGRNQSVLSFSRIPINRRSIGHGQDWSGGRNLARESRTWLTIAENEKRRSNTSASSTYEVPQSSQVFPRKTIRQVTKSPSIPPQSMVLSESSGNSRLSRPVSRRVGSSPFFGGSSIRNSGKITKKPFRTSYADSPTVPEEAIMDSLEATIAQGLREMSDGTDPQDSFGISYGMAREGTRQLRSYIQSHLGARTKTISSIRSYESRDSRFESAPGSMSQMDQCSETGVHLYDDVYEDYIPDGFSEGSWETQRGARDEEGSVVTDGDVVQNPGLAYGNSKSTPTSPKPGGAARIVDGAGMRPMSTDASGVQRMGTQRGVMDYSAYI
ncbi:hypothetical protein BKA65DRAFT_246140 [Rhexocercosporidium sp. MPI-PUGE-AT-0058]|nr:hypothetical protein BKA65DRAFT_246140 [Rhexocercosporidium sp. MPI-PUGE-AT-0058]